MAKGNGMAGAREKAQRDARAVLALCEELAELAFDVFINSSYAHYLRALELNGQGVACGQMAAYAHFSMSYAAFQTMRRFCRQQGDALRGPQIESFLRCYRDFNASFSLGWGFSAEEGALQERFTRLEESYAELRRALGTASCRARALLREAGGS